MRQETFFFSQNIQSKAAADWNVARPSEDLVFGITRSDRMMRVSFEEVKV